MEKNYVIRPGFLEVYCGPMKSGKTRELINRIDKLRFMEDSPFIFFKPKVDIRDKTIKSRFGDLTYECVFIDENKPGEIFDHISWEHKLIVIDEIHFFNKSIVEVINKLLKKGFNIVVSGLDLNFKGEPFGPMGELLAFADHVVKLNGVCEYPGCNNLANRTQRLINNQPAEYNEPLISIEGSSKEENYECRCLKHHFVPRKT